MHLFLQNGALHMQLNLQSCARDQLQVTTHKQNINRKIIFGKTWNGQTL